MTLKLIKVPCQRSVSCFKAIGNLHLVYFTNEQYRICDKWLEHWAII